MFLYHGTYRSRLNSIQARGLIPNCFTNWGELSLVQSGVYLTDCYDEAYALAETAPCVEDSVYDSGVVVLAIHRDRLDRLLLKMDKNMQTEEGDCGIGYFIYHGTIPSRWLDFF